MSRTERSYGLHQKDRASLPEPILVMQQPLTRRKFAGGLLVGVTMAASGIAGRISSEVNLPPITESPTEQEPTPLPMQLPRGEERSLSTVLDSLGEAPPLSFTDEVRSEFPVFLQENWNLHMTTIDLDFFSQRLSPQVTTTLSIGYELPNKTVEVTHAAALTRTDLGEIIPDKDSDIIVEEGRETTYTFPFIDFGRPHLIMHQSNGHGEMVMRLPINPKPVMEFPLSNPGSYSFFVSSGAVVDQAALEELFDVGVMCRQYGVNLPRVVVTEEPLRSRITVPSDPKANILQVPKTLLPDNFNGIGRPGAMAIMRDGVNNMFDPGTKAYEEVEGYLWRLEEMMESEITVREGVNGRIQREVPKYLEAMFVSNKEYNTSLPTISDYEEVAYYQTADIPPELRTPYSRMILREFLPLAKFRPDEFRKMFYQLSIDDRERLKPFIDTCFTIATTLQSQGNSQTFTRGSLFSEDLQNLL